MTVSVIPNTGGMLYQGLSSDTKPTSVPANSRFFATDTYVWYVTFDGTNWQLEDRIGEVTTSPTSNTILARLKDIVTALTLYTEANIDTGTATSGSNTTIADTGKSWTVDMWKNAFVQVKSLATSKEYLTQVTSNTADTLTIPALPGAYAVVVGDTYALKIPVHVTDIERWGGTTLTGRDISLDLKAITDDSIKGLLKSIGDIGAGDNIVTLITAIKTAVEIIDDWDETNRAAVNTISGQVGVQAGAGATDALTQRMTLASDDPAVVDLAAIEILNTAIKTALEIMDDWDESDRAKVNPIAGQAGVAAGAGAVDALTQRVILASDDPAVTLLGTIDTDTGVIAGGTTSIDGKTPALGNAAMAAASPVTIASDDTLITAIKTAVELIDNFISGARGLVTEDNSGSIKTAVEAVNTAIQSGGITQTQLAAIQTAVELIDNAISGNEMQVDVVAELPAGTQIIGKVGIDQTTPGTTNGVQVNAELPAGTQNIGDVDIASLPSGNLGQQAKAASLSIAPATDITDGTYIGDIKFGEGLPANSGVDIGDVDVTSLPVGNAAMAASTPVTIASDDTLITALKTALETIDNFISGSRGLVTEDNSDAIKTAVELIDNAISGNEMQVDIADRTVFNPVTGSAAISGTVAPGAKFRLLRFEMHLSAAGTTSENFTITIDAGDGAAYDINLITRDLSVNSEVDIVETFGQGYEYEADDEIDIAWPNTETRTYGLRVVYELI